MAAAYHMGRGLFHAWPEQYEELIDKYGGPSIMMMSGTSRRWCMGSYGVFRILFGSPKLLVGPYDQVCKGPRHFATLMNSAYAFSWQGHY